MTTQEVKRKLIAILSADVKGYQRLIAKDEASTLHTLNAYKEVMANLIRDHHGRVVDAPGDNVLAEFASVVDAVECGVEIQRELRTRNQKLPEHRKMEFRIGINLGDVVEEEDKIFGDGVSIAARMQSLADRGGICISGIVYDQIRNKIALKYEYLGKQRVKNIAGPVKVYRVMIEPETLGSVADRWKRAGANYWKRIHPAFKILVALVAAGNALWQIYPRISKSPVDVTPKEKVAISLPEKPSATTPPSTEVAPKEKMPPSKSEKVSNPVTSPPPQEEVASKDKMAFPLPDLPSIAVLPFVNMSEDPKQEFLCDGITENIITALSKVPRLFVIARNSTFTYKGKPVKVKQVSEELGVRYVLEGSIQRSADRIRINAQLIDALTGRHVWAERYDRDLQDVFALQDEITMKILVAVRVKLAGGDEALMSEKFYEKYYKGKQGLDCYLKLLEARKYQQGSNIESNRAARRLTEEAISMCPENPAAYNMMGWVHLLEYWVGSGKSPQDSIEKGIEMARKTLSMDDSIASAYTLLSHFYSLKREYDKSIAEAERAVALDPGGATVHAYYAISLNYACRWDEAIPMFQKAIRLDPVGPSSLYVNFGTALRMTGRFEEAVSAFKKALQRAPDNILAHINLAATYSMMGREQEARAEAAEVIRINPKFSVDSYAKRLVFRDQSVIDNTVDNLRKVGLK